jgi:PTH1 family peptidyl-tRNA hydrolase
VTDRWLVVGLGNPGPTYARTRHNVGHLVLDVLAERCDVRLRRHRCVRCDVAETRVATTGPRMVLARPRSYMNESGGPVKAAAAFYKVSPAQVVVVHDELDLPFGALRVKLGGGDNGHNGLRSVRGSLGTGEFLRVRVGIGRPTGRLSPADFVLSGFSAEERTELGEQVTRAADAVESLLCEGLERTQSRYNS